MSKHNQRYPANSEYFQQTQHRLRMIAGEFVELVSLTEELEQTPETSTVTATVIVLRYKGTPFTGHGAIKGQNADRAMVLALENLKHCSIHMLLQEHLQFRETLGELEVAEALAKDAEAELASMPKPNTGKVSSAMEALREELSKLFGGQVELVDANAIQAGQAMHEAAEKSCVQHNEELLQALDLTQDGFIRIGAQLGLDLTNDEKISQSVDSILNGITGLQNYVKTMHERNSKLTQLDTLLNQLEQLGGLQKSRG